jgi:uncharacterized surface protein with fasciclin (FAS1) repeats
MNNMKQLQRNKWIGISTVFLAGIIFLAACNKDVPEPTPIVTAPGTGPTIGSYITTDTTYSYLLAAVNRVGLSDLFNNTTSLLTVFAPNNAAFRASGIPSIAVINALPLTTLTPLIQYHVLGGIKLTSAAIPDSFANAQMSSLFILPAPNTNPLVRMTNFPSKRGTNTWINNIPVTVPDIQVSNGVIHSVARVVAPPSRVLADTLSRDTSLTFFMAAVVRADLGLPASGKMIALLSNAGANFTVFAPNNNAVRALLVANGLPPDISSIGFLPIPTLIGITTYHIHIANFIPTQGIPINGIRTFSANIPTTPTPVNSYLKAILYPNPAPPLVLNATQGVKGYANATFSNIIAYDRNCVNGVFHIIDQVLRAQ